MIAITLARKPVVGTVARNALRFGVGALNIDASRIKLDEGEQVHVPQSDPTKRVGEVGRDLGITRSSAEKMQQAQRESIERTNTLGRFPANVVLSHRDGCVQEGTKSVKGSHPVAAAGNKPSEYTRFQHVYTSGGGRAPTSQVDAEGRETVSNWVCTPDCPVPHLDQQSIEGGMHSAGIARDKVIDKQEYAASSFHIGGVHNMRRLGDAGGASRFYKQFGGMR